jgi:hypothetical protein
MEIDTEKLLEHAVRDAIREGVVAKFKGYNSPLDKMAEEVIKRQDAPLRQILVDAIQSCVSDPTFREEIAAATRTALAKTLVQRFGGEIEKQVNALKSDPTTRARITLAIEEIVKSQPH